MKNARQQTTKALISSISRLEQKEIQSCIEQLRQNTLPKYFIDALEKEFIGEQSYYGDVPVEEKKSGQKRKTIPELTRLLNSFME